MGRRGGRGSRLGPRLEALAAATLFSTGGAAIKATSLTSWQVASFRSGVAVLAFLLLVPAARRLPSRRALLVGFAYAGALVTYALANKLTTAASVIFLGSVSPLYVLVLAGWWLREPLRRRDLVYMTLLALGFALVVSEPGPPLATAPDPGAGNVLAALSGLFWALLLVGLRWLGRDEGVTVGPSAGAVWIGNALAFLVCLPLALPVERSAPADWALVAFLGTVQIALAYRFLTAALRRLPALEVALLVLLEPVLNPLWAWWLHGETPGPWTLAGGAVILGGTAWKALEGREAHA